MGAWVLKVDCKGKLDIKGQKWRVGKALSGEWVHVVPVEQRMMVFYCTTLIRELDPAAVHRSTIIGRYLPTPVSGRIGRDPAMPAFASGPLSSIHKSQGLHNR